MTDRFTSENNTFGRVLATAILFTTAFLSTGCEFDSWLYDPSIVGRWEHTPTIVPVLERLDVIERDEGQFVDTTPVMPGDLLPEVSDYEVGPGDALVIEIWDFLQPNLPTPFQRIVDPRGQIDLPQLGRINIHGLTEDQVRSRIVQTLRDKGIIQEALVTVQLTSQRQQTYSIFGAIQGVGRYFVPAPDFRILEALTEAGGVSPAIKKVYVIRQIPLSDEVQHGAGAQLAPKPDPIIPPDQAPTDQGRDLNDLINELSQPLDDPKPGVFGTNERGFAPPETEEPQDAPIDLIDDPSITLSTPPAQINPQTNVSADPGRWVFLNGEWVRVIRKANTDALPEGEDALAHGLTASELVTQRVIVIPVAPLLEGRAEYNIVIRPGDVIRVPAPEQGIVYLGGPGIARPGPYQLPIIGRLTLSRALVSAGGLNGLAVPWRVDLTRMVGPDRQATIRLDFAAIAEGSQPDIFLKADDMINVGTAFWATPLAIIRNGFRMSYGFGFLLDRNFGNDVFGAPPFSRDN